MTNPATCESCGAPGAMLVPDVPLNEPPDHGITPTVDLWLCAECKEDT